MRLSGSMLVKLHRIVFKLTIILPTLQDENRDTARTVTEQVETKRCTHEATPKPLSSISTKVMVVILTYCQSFL